MCSKICSVRYNSKQSNIFALSCIRMRSLSISANGKQSLSFISLTYSASTFSHTHCSGGFAGTAKRRTWPWPRALPPRPSWRAPCPARPAWQLPRAPRWATCPPRWPTCPLPRPWSLPGLPLSSPKIYPRTLERPPNQGLPPRVRKVFCLFGCGENLSSSVVVLLSLWQLELLNELLSILST